MTERLPVSPALGPLEDYSRQFTARTERGVLVSDEHGERTGGAKTGRPAVLGQSGPDRHWRGQREQLVGR